MAQERRHCNGVRVHCPGVTAGADGVVSIPVGQAVRIDGACRTVYLLGTGSVQLVGSDYTACPFKTSAQGGSGADSVARAAIEAHAADAYIHVTADEKAYWNTLSGENELDNPDFRVNQRDKSGTITEAGYFVDRWKLISGSVIINPDGTLTLDGTIRQILERAAGADVTASASAGTASYDDGTKTFTLTASGEVISWAKLEAGNKATPFVKPAFAAELAKCQRYLYVLRGSLLRAGLAEAYSTSYALFYLYAPASFRTVPSVSFENVVLSSTKDGSVYSEAANIQVRGCNSNSVKLLVNAADLLTIGEQYELGHKPDTVGSIVLSAEL